MASDLNLSDMGMGGTPEASAANQQLSDMRKMVGSLRSKIRNNQLEFQ